jgi:PRTRC genetic system protein A
MQRPYVDYLVARGDEPPRSGLIYDYLIAGDGVWLAAENAALRIRAPVAPAAIRGLPPIGGRCELRHGRLPAALWSACVAAARAAAVARREILFLAILGPGGYRLVAPTDQVASATRVAYTPPVLAVGEAVALALHSHHTMPAYFSATDDADEQDLGLYGVLGRLLGDTPEVALRAGVYGHWLPVPWEAVFDGDRGAFRDTAFDPPPLDEPAGTGDDDDGPGLPDEVDIARMLRRALWSGRAGRPWRGHTHPLASRSERP